MPYAREKKIKILFPFIAKSVCMVRGFVLFCLNILSSPLSWIVCE
jgi:hypothetical protein